MSIKDDYQEFKQALTDLKINSKPQINFLTILAEEKIPNATQVVRAIEERIIDLRGDAVLPVFYVLDSIVKNLRSSNYSQLFEQRLPFIFASAFNKVDERTRLAMYKLRQTWTPYFSNQALHNLDTRTHYIDPAWPITARQPESTSLTTNVPSRPPTTTTTTTTTNDENDRTTTSKASGSRESNYNMIPIDRIRSTAEHSSEQYDQPVKPSVINERKDPRQQPTAQFVDETKLTKTIELPIINENSNTNDTNDDDADNLFGGTDIDYRDIESSLPGKTTTTATTTTTTTNTSTNLDSDRIFELNNKCFSLAEEKYKSKELSTEEYQATLKLLQKILESEAQRLIGGPNPPSFVNNPTTSTNPLSTLTTNPTNPFPNQTFLPFSNPTANPSFPFAGFANETHRHVSQILAAAGQSGSLASALNFLPFIPPLPPAPPSFPLVPTPFPSAANVASATSASVLYPGRQSPPVKRPHPETTNAENQQNEEEAKRQRVDSIISSSHNFDEENIAPVPFLIDANINTLKKKYLGVIQQLYIGKFQCRACGLRFTSKQKNAYDNHLDWHFAENQQASAAAARFQSSRDWYPSLQEWTIHEEDEQIRTNQIHSKHNRQGKGNDLKHFSSNSIADESSCLAKSSGDVDDDHCFVCHDTLEPFYDDNREEWRLKDAIRIDGKTYHRICYEDIQDQMNYEKDSMSLRNDLIKSMDTSSQRTNGNTADSQTVETAMATAKIKSETEDSNDDDEHSSGDESSKPPYLSSMSFVNLVETIYVKKEDLKQIENFETISTNIKEELIDSSSISEEIPFLSIKHESC